MAETHTTFTAAAADDLVAAAESWPHRATLRTLLPGVDPETPLTDAELLTALRRAEEAARGRARELWGFAAMNAEAATNATPGVRPAAAELWAVAAEYAQLATTKP